MDANKFGCFVAERRKELKMTQKDLAAKIQVTDKAVSKWERGLGFPDINTIEDLADALDVSIMELMKSERKTNEVSAEEMVVNDVVQIAKSDIEERQKSVGEIDDLGMLKLLQHADEIGEVPEDDGDGFDGLNQ